MRVVGIDIGSYSVKVADLEASTSNYSLVRYQEYPFSPDPQRDRQLQLIEILRSLAQSYDLANTRFVIGIPQQLTSGRLKFFPFRERPKIIKSLSFELEDDIPLDPDTTVFDAKVLEYVGKGAQAWCVAIPKEAVTDILRQVQEGSLDPEVVTVEGLALSNLFEPWQLPPPQSNEIIESQVASEITEVSELSTLVEREAKVILNIGHSRTLILIYRENVMVSIRTLLWGGQDVAQSIASTFNVPYFEALKVLETKSFVLLKPEGATRDQVALSKSVSDALEFLLRPLKLALLETKNEYGLNYTEIQILGGVSQIQNLLPYFTRSLGVTCTLARPFASIRNIGIADTTSVQMTSAVAIGLAIEGMKRPRNPALNIRRGEWAKENQTFARVWEKWGYTVQLGICAFFILLLYGIFRDSTASDLAEKADVQLSTLAKNYSGIRNANEGSVRKHINYEKKVIQAHETLSKLKDYNSGLEILTHLSQAIPTTADAARVDINVLYLDLDNEDVYIQGTISARHKNRLREWIQKVARPGTKVVDVPPTRAAAKAVGIPFAYEFKVGRLQ